MFKKFVKGQRPSLDIEKVATGETWFGQDALDRHLCDELRTFDDVKLDLFEAGAEVLQVLFSASLHRWKLCCSRRARRHW